ncbi:MAG: ABC transporter permease subunit [Lachnospiraceae bacterium]|nr:ABC transporter permease subunit [Lachnospiraceae bacterium]
MLAVYKKELRQTFTSIFGYMFLAFLLALIGFYVYQFNLKLEYASFAYPLASVTLFFLLLVPMLTMRILSEEKKQKTDQLLFTSPVSIPRIILGKYLALVTVLLIAMVIISFYPLVLSSYGDVNMKIAYSNIVAFFLLGCAYFAIGMFISTLTESQIVAAILTFIVILVTLLADALKDRIPSDHAISFIVLCVLAVLLGLIAFVMMKSLIVSGAIAAVCVGALCIVYFAVDNTLFDGFLTKMLGWISLVSRFENFRYGLFDSAAYVYYLSLIFLFVFLTVLAIKKRRWS